MSGLTDRERRLLEDGRQHAAKMMALERERLAKMTQRDAERRAQAENDRAEHRALYGPQEIVGPDGVPVNLRVKASGIGGVGAVGLGGASGDLLILIATLTFMIVANVFSHFVLFLGGSTLHITAPDRKKIKIRLRSKAAAAQRLREVAEAVRREGVAALDKARWRGAVALG
jgi:hypothetical protein